MEMIIDRLHALLGTVVNELGAAQNATLVILGDELDLYRKLAAEGPLTSTELAATSGTHERYVREWLAAQAASGFVTYHADQGKFSMTPEQAAVFAVDESPANVVGGFQALDAIFADRHKLRDAFRNGGGVLWTERCNCMFCGTDRFFRAGYRANLLSSWLPALDGVVEKLERGATVADIGCGYGSSTIIMAEHFPNSRFLGVDFHDASIVHARENARGHGNVSFETARAQDFSGTGYDFVCMFDSLHDMGDPVGAVRYIRERIKPDGTLMIVEPMAGDSLAENLNPVGRIFYAASTNACVPASLGQEVGAALGAQAGQKKLTEVLEAGGFQKVRRVAETPFNMILEARL